jgi:hypothetical protein
MQLINALKAAITLLEAYATGDPASESKVHPVLTSLKKARDEYHRRQRGDERRRLLIRLMSERRRKGAVGEPSVPAARLERLFSCARLSPPKQQDLEKPL